MEPRIDQTSVRANWRTLSLGGLQKPWDSILVFLVNLTLTVPIFIILHQNLIDPEWPYHIDRIVLFLVLLVVIQILFQFIRIAIYFCVIASILFFSYGTLTGGYGFYSVYEDYRYMMYAMIDNPNPQDIIINRLLPFPNKAQIIKAVEYNHPEVRTFAISATNKHFKNVKGYSKHRVLIQCFAVFKEINSNWYYVSDPKGREYIATSRESVRLMSGDCDDHSILMAAAVLSIGGTPRLIHTKGHIYPEILIGRSKAELEEINYLIKEVLFPAETKGKELHYHVDERGQIWLNLDYTAKYPGGPFMHEEILGALTLN